MPFEPGSFEDVEAWAQRDFPTYFAALSAFAIGERQNRPAACLIPALDVGVTTAGTAVYTRITGGSDVELFCDHKVKAAGDTEDLWCIKPVTGLEGVKLATPFPYCEGGHPARIDRLEALIRYAYLKPGEKEAVSPKLGFFHAHFRGACRDVARGTGASTEADEMADDEALSGDSPPGLIEDTDIDGLRDYQASTSIFNQHVHAMDKSYHEVQTGMLRQLGAMQILDRENMLQVQARDQDLTLRLASAEEDRFKMGRESETQKTKIKAALEEADKWKAQD